MYSIKGIYENGEVKLFEEAHAATPCNVIVTFLNEDEQEIKSIRESIDEDSFQFWMAKEEDVYQDYVSC